MAESDKKSQSSAKADEKAADEAAVEEPTYHRDRLTRESGDFFGVGGHVVAGALEHAKVGNKQNFTRSEVEDAIKAFEDHEVEMIGQEG